MVVRQVFERIWNAIDWLAAAMAAGIYCLLRLWLEGVVAYALAVHGYVPDSNASCDSPSGDDEEGTAQEFNQNRDGCGPRLMTLVGVEMTHGDNSNLRDRF
jgi:hypothetical protein